MPKLPVSPSAALLPPRGRTLTCASSGGGGVVAHLSRSLSTPSLLSCRRFENECTVPAARKSSVAPLEAAISGGVVSQPGPSIDSYPKYDRLMPCPSQNTTPRVEHLVVSERENVVEFISKTLDLPPLYVVDLIHFGAVFYALVCPKPPPTATPEQHRVYKVVTKHTVLNRRLSIRGKTLREAQKTLRVTDPNQLLEEGMYLRVHVHVKRFPRCYEVDWKSRVIEITDSYVVLDKPAGVSV